MQELPALFVSHGAPDLLLSQEPARQALVSLGQTLPQPKGILVVSAHWQAAQFTLGVAPEYSTLHDFSGFPAALYQLRYPAKGADWFSDLCRMALQDAVIDYSEDPLRGLDHGAWVPLMLAWPKAEIPILTLSLKTGASLQEYLRLGHALTSLRQSGVLLIASGAITHNLGNCGLRDQRPSHGHWNSQGGWRKSCRIARPRRSLSIVTEHPSLKKLIRLQNISSRYWSPTARGERAPPLSSTIASAMGIWRWIFMLLMERATAKLSEQQRPEALPWCGHTIRPVANRLFFIVGSKLRRTSNSSTKILSSPLPLLDL